MNTARNFLIIVMLALPAGPGMAATPPSPTARPDLCATALEGPDYVPGVDAQGRPVPRADIGATPVPVPDTVAVPLAGRGGGRSRGPGRGRAAAGADGPYAAIDGRRLAPLVNPSNPCPN